MSLKSTLAAMARPLSLVLEDKTLLPEPLLAVALYDFEGESDMAELTFAKGQMLRIFCEDFGASWSLAMLVDAQGDEVSIDEHDDGPPSLTRGLVAQGFYEYVSEPSTAASHLERHKATIPDSRDESLDDTPSSPIDTVVLQTSEQPQSADEKHSKDADTADADRPTSPQAVVHAAPDTSADYLDESSILSSVIVVASDDANGEEGSSAYEQQSTVTDADLLEPSRLVNSPIPDTADTVTNKHILPLPVFPAPATVRTRQTSTNSLLKPSNPIEAYLKSDLPYEPQDDLDARDVIEIEDGQWSAKIPPFHVAIPSYSQRRVTGSGGEYTVFQVISSITLPNRQSQAESSEGPDSSDQERSSPAQHPEVRQIIVDRRYTHFQHLHTILKASLPLLTMPDLPEKRLTGNFNPDFLNTRRRDLGRYLSRLARHELVRSNKAFLDFLGNENEEAYDSSLPRMLMQALRSEPESFFTRIKHDSDYFDEQQLLEEVTEEHDRMARHVRAVEKGQATSAIYDGLSQYRERLQGTSTALSDIAVSIISLVSGLAQPKGAATNTDEEQPESTDRTRRRRERAKAHNMQNKDGAFCWREMCQECLSTTKVVQGAAEAVALVADLYDANARTVLLHPQEQLIEYSLPRQRYQALLSNMKLAQDHVAELIKNSDAEDVKDDIEADKARAEVVLNSLMAEIEHIHNERREDLQKIAVTFLNGQIAFHERALAKLKDARNRFEVDQLEELAHQGPRLPSILEKAVIDPPKAKPALSKASSYGLPALPQSGNLRPITSLVSTLFSSAVGLSGSWRSAISAIKAQNPTTAINGPEDLRERLASPTLASSSRFVQFLDWTMNSRGEHRQYA